MLSNCIALVFTPIVFCAVAPDSTGDQAARETFVSYDRSAMQQSAQQDRYPPVAELLPNFTFPPKLCLGDAAPPLKVSETVKGEPITKLEAGQVYVIEFWATWCGPCIQQMPHLSRIQEQYGQKVRVVGVDIFEKDDQGRLLDAEARSKLVNEFVARHDDQMNYTVVIESKRDMEHTWLKSAGRDSIPTTFIVDKNGRIAWIGHPMDMDLPLKQILDGTFDQEAALNTMKSNAEEWAGYMFFLDSIAVLEGIPGEDDPEKVKLAYRVGRSLAHHHYHNQPRRLADLAFQMLTGKHVKYPDFQFAFDIASLAREKMETPDAFVLETYARALDAHDPQRRQDAIELLKQAKPIATAREKERIETLLQQWNR